MHQHQIATLRQRIDGQAREYRRHQRTHDRYNKGWRHVGVALLIALLCVAALSGCSSGEAQQIGELASKEIRTFAIDIETFFMQTDNPPDVNVKDEATVYTMKSDGELSFQTAGGATSTIDLDRDDIVIERPGAGTITVIVDQ